MIKGFFKLVIITFALIGMVNVYNSSTFQSLLKKNTGTFQSINNVVKDVTHADSIKK